MNVAIWVVQVLLALTFLMSGIMKTMQPREKLAANMGWVNDFPQSIVRGIGAVEILAAIGLILPALTGIATFLTPLAAVGLILTMIGAMVTHLRRGENSVIIVNLVLLALAAFVVYGRFVAVPL